ncbi:MAG: signal peptide peptidase SppA [Saprospiraceae bacterium]|nr:signal peptide peptidase SppA [Saprospiraceae bacterium]
MVQFLKMLLASCLGLFLALVLISLIGMGVVAGLVQSQQPKHHVEANSVLHLTFDDAIPEQTNNIEMQTFDLKNEKVLGLTDIVNALETAAKDDNIKGVFMEVDQLAAGFATSSILRDALADFRSQGKFVLTYSKYYTQGAYYVSSVADQIYINPLGLLDFRGFAAQVPFMKDMLDKVGVKMQVYYAGKFKSATEPYRRNDMSPENRLQLREFLDEAYTLYLEDVAASRQLPLAELRRLADGYLGADPEDALRHKLVDKVGYRDEALADLRGRLGLKEDDKIKMVSLRQYFTAKPPKVDLKIKDKIAVIYAEGSIVDGKGDMGMIGDDKYIKVIEKIAKDDKVKAVVLRVNSPGGSAMSSENIWRALTRLKEEGKPLVVSMGDYAASGGYYIACVADSILAEPNTLTGSIGVFSVLPSMDKLFNDKLGIHFDTVKTGRFATGFSPFYDHSPEEARYLQKRTDQMYETFLKRVSEGRGKSRDEVNEIAQGRVWTGRKAMELGLVDKLGSLDDAIATAAHMAKISEYRPVEYPAVKEPIQQLLEDLLGEEEESTIRKSAIRKEMGEWYPYYAYLQELSASKGMQARVPFIWEYR